jgi:type IV secretion system protein VirB9
MKLAALLLTLTPAGPAGADGTTDAGEARPAATWRLGGDRALRPEQIWDDGYYTYIIWPDRADLPAIFSRGRDGREVVAEGTMIEGRYVLDQVHALLVFRIDRASATARRRAAAR